MKKLLVLLLVIPLIVVMATKDPSSMGKLVQLVFTVGAKLLDAVAALLTSLVRSFSH